MMSRRSLIIMLLLAVALLAPTGRAPRQRRPLAEQQQPGTSGTGGPQQQQKKRSAPVTLAWAANSEPDLAGYILYWGALSGNYVANVDVGNVTQATVNPGRGRHYFACTAYNTSGLESAFSNEVAWP